MTVVNLLAPAGVGRIPMQHIDAARNAPKTMFAHLDTFYERFARTP